MERQVPSGIPGILPLVWHRDDVLIHHVEPFRIPHEARTWLHRINAMFLEPFVHIEKEKLFGPKHPGERLTHNQGFIRADSFRSYRFVELVCLSMPSLQSRGEALEGIIDRCWC